MRHFVARRHELFRVIREHGSRVEFTLESVAGNDGGFRLGGPFQGGKIQIRVPLLELRALRIMAADAICFEDGLYVFFKIHVRADGDRNTGKQGKKQGG